MSRQKNSAVMPKPMAAINARSHGTGMRRAIYFVMLVMLIAGGGAAAVALILYAQRFPVWAFLAPAFLSLFSAYLLWDDFIKPWLGGRSSS